MKKTYILLAAFLAVCTALPALAQSENSGLANKVKRAAAKAAAEAKAHKHPVCAYCGEQISTPNQHCSAKNGIGLCSESAAPARTERTTDETPSACPKCGKAYTIDEKYHGGQHVCQVNKDDTHAHPVCALCGNPILDIHQHCSAKNSIGLCTTSAEPNHPERTTDKTPSACPKCGKAYTIDEKYHCVPHVCPVQTTQTTLNAGPNGGEPECGVVFIESSEPAVQRGPNGGEPETNFFFVISDDENVNRGPNGGEPEGPSYVEIDEGALHQAESLLQADRDANNGHPKHNLAYYYKQIISKK